MTSGKGTPCTPSCVQPSQTNAHCRVCHRTFGSVSGFDAHRVPLDGVRRGNRPARDSGPLKRCVDPTWVGMTERGGVWRRYMTEEQIQQRFGGMRANDHDGIGA